MATANEVKAQIRLRFYNTNKVRINCVRNLQVTRKKGGGLTMKTLEAILQTEDTQRGENRRTTLSTKCAEVDEEVPASLGVSRAILDNVIFCHQEDNNWPLGEPSSLKKRFDDIFEATRYTKALDNIKSLRKERAVSLKVGKAELEGLKVDRQRADAVKEKIKKMEAELEDKEERLEGLNVEIEELTLYNKELYDKAVKFRETVVQAETLEERKQLREGNLKVLKDAMTELHEDESELKRRKNGFKSHLEDLKRNQDERKRQISSKKSDLAEVDRTYSKRLSEKGALESEKKHHERALRSRQEVIQQISTQLGMRGYDADSLTDESIQEFSEQVEDDLRRLKREFDQMKSEDSSKEDDLSRRYQDLLGMLRAKESSRTTLTEDMKKLRDRIKKIQNEIEDAPSAQIDIDAAKKEHTTQKARLEELNKEQIEAKHDEKIATKNSEIREMDDRRETLTTELNSLNRQADFRAKLDMNKKAAEQKKASIESLFSRNADMFTRYIGGTSSAEKVEEEVLKAIARKEEENVQLETEAQEVARRHQQVESNLAFARNQVKEKQEQARSIEEQIDRALEGEYTTLDEALKQCQKEIDYSKDQIAMYESMSSFVKNLSAQVKDKKSCLGCNRGINHDELPAIEAHVADLFQKSQPARLQSYREDMAIWEEQQQKYLELKPSLARLEQLRDEEIAKHEKEITEAQEKMRNTQEEVDGSLAKVETVKSALRDLANLRRVASDIVRLSAEQAQSEKDAESIERDLRSTGSVRTGDQVQEEIDNLTDKIKRVKRELQTIQQEKESLRVTISNQERSVHKAEMAVAQKMQDHEKLLAQESRLEELKIESNEQSEKLKRIETDVEKSKEPIRSLGEELELFKAESSRKQQAAQAKISDVSGHVRQLQESNTAVELFISSRGPQKLKECQESIERLKRETREAQESIDKIQKDVDSIEKDLNESRATERNISDNLRYLELSREVKQIDNDLKNINLDDASRARKDWEKKYNDSKRQENDMNGKASHLNGETSSLKAQIKARERELRDDYKNVHETFTKKLIEVKTSELGQNDLELYQKALNAAIMRFHSIKMEEINETLNNLWGKTYKGTDIDTIMIKADGEGSGNRSYNYRVIMVKDSVEMDMRGRCSAGQKCLASILIRLALADSFSENCGIMALDEPTTNLDEHNIMALAESLGTLIDERRRQSNFQLIIITHDTKFLSQLSQSCGGIDRYFHVARDNNYRSMIHLETQLP